MEPSYPQVVHKRRSFMATLAMGASAIAVMVTLSLAAIFIYGMNIVDRKSDNLIGFAEQVVRQVPQLREWLPPVLKDAISDERSVSYQSDLDVTVKVVRGQPGRATIQPVVVVKNNGDRVVSFLSMRIVILDPDGIPLAEMNEWAATPIAGDSSWRGPIFPGAKRFFSAGSVYLSDRRRLVTDAPGGLRLEGISGEVEITELRLWNPDEPRVRRASATALEAPRAAEKRAAPADGDVFVVDDETVTPDPSVSEEESTADVREAAF